MDKTILNRKIKKPRTGTISIISQIKYKYKTLNNSL